MKYLICLILSINLLFFSSNYSLAKDHLKIATTTSFVDSGLADIVSEYFYDKYRKKLLFISAGTLKALKLGEKKEVALVVSHNQEAEEEFIKKGFGSKRLPFMYNYFLLVGPVEDPAKITGLKLKNALSKIKETGNKYISRADMSGTHLKEMEIFKKFNIVMDKSWVLETGTAMGETLLIANQKKAYTLADEATFNRFKDKLKLKIAVKDESLKNIYSIIVVSGFEKETAEVIDFFSGSLFREILKKENRFFYPVN